MPEQRQARLEVKLRAEHEARAEAVRRANLAEQGQAQVEARLAILQADAQVFLQRVDSAERRTIAAQQVVDVVTRRVLDLEERLADSEDRARRFENSASELQELLWFEEESHQQTQERANSA